MLVCFDNEDPLICHIIINSVILVLLSVVYNVVREGLYDLLGGPVSMPVQDIAYSATPGMSVS
jgi:hypothetical protein